MERISKTEKHPFQTALYSVSMGFERASYYGVRALVVMFATGEAMNMPREQVFGFIAWITWTVLVSKIVGALVGDLLLGNRRAALTGGILQTFGAFAFCFQNEIGIYVGIGLIVLGSGLYVPNVFAQFGKQYLEKTKLLDSGFTILITAINFGAFLGIVLIGIVGEEKYIYGFLLGGLCMIISVVAFYFAKDAEKLIQIQHHSVFVHKGIRPILWMIGLLTIYRVAYLFMDSGIKTIKESFDVPYKSVFLVMDTNIVMCLGIVAGIIWSYIYYNQFYKLAVGFVFAAISIAVMMTIPGSPEEHQMPLFIFSMLSFSIAEIHLFPVIDSIITKNVNPKYLAIAISLVYLPMVGIYEIAEYFSSENPLPFEYGSLILGVIGLGLFSILHLKNKKQVDL